MRTTTILLFSLLAACGGGTTTTHTHDTHGGGHGGGTTGGGGETRVSWTDRAVQSYLSGDLDRAAAQADAAMQLDHDDAHAMEIAARVALAHRDAAKAREVLASAHGPVLLRLRARAAALAGEAAPALADLEAVDGQEPADGWAVAMLPILRDAGSTPLYALSGAPEATLAYVGDSSDAVPLPVVHVTIDGHACDALVSTAAGLTVVPQAAGAQTHGKMLATIELGGLTVSHVPAITRDLADVSRVTHRDIGAVIGTEVLLRLHATMDGRNRRLVVRQAAPPQPAHDVATADWAAFEGAMLAVRASIDGGPRGFWEVDTSLDLPMALTQRAVSDAHVPAERMQPAPGAPPDVKMVQGLLLHLGSADIGGVPGIVGIVPDELAHIAGTRIDGILGQQIFGQVTMTIDTETRTLWLE